MQLWTRRSLLSSLPTRAGHVFTLTRAGDGPKIWRPARDNSRPIAHGSIAYRWGPRKFRSGAVSNVVRAGPVDHDVRRCEKRAGDKRDREIDPQRNPGGRGHFGGRPEKPSDDSERRGEQQSANTPAPVVRIKGRRHGDTYECRRNPENDGQHVPDCPHNRSKSSIHVLTLYHKETGKRKRSDFEGA